MTEPSDTDNEELVEELCRANRLIIIAHASADEHFHRSKGHIKRSNEYRLFMRHARNTKPKTSAMRKAYTKLSQVRTYDELRVTREEVQFAAEFLAGTRKITDHGK